VFNHTVSKLVGEQKFWVMAMVKSMVIEGHKSKCLVSSITNSSDCIHVCNQSLTEVHHNMGPSTRHKHGLSWFLNDLNHPVLLSQLKVVGGKSRIDMVEPGDSFPIKGLHMGVIERFFNAWREKTPALVSCSQRVPCRCA